MSIKPTRITSAAVIGAGTMGSRIAAAIANSDTPVWLLDIVPKGANDRDMLAKKAIERMKQDKSLFTEAKANHIRPGNMEDDLGKLAQADWVIECVPEDERIKQETYRKVGAHTNPRTLVSSNTSTIPLRKLKEGLDEMLAQRLCITHFFNPPTVMPLVELVTDQDNDPQFVRAFVDFADRQLGKHVIMAKDTPGFIANRIGMFWLLCAMEEAQREQLSIEAADAVMNGAFGFPKTGVFGLADLIGLKLIPDIAKSMDTLLPKDDAFCQLQDGLALVETQLSRESGFYRGKGKEREALDLQSGSYHKAEKPDIAIEHWHSFLAQETPESRFALRTLTRLLAYAAQVTPEIADSVADADAAMRDGYGWKYGPFEIIDRLGASWLIERIGRDGSHVPILLKQAEEQGFYPLHPPSAAGRTEYMGFSGRYRAQPLPMDQWTLTEKTVGTQPVLESDVARLWDVGDGIACFEITTKMSTIDERVLDALAQAVERAESGFTGLIIGHDGKHFSAGFNLHIVLDSARNNDWQRVDAILKQGQETMLRVKRSRVPVIAAIFGYTLGGACELTMHCAGAQAHTLTQLGLVETSIGVIPAWGGTKEHLWDAVRHGDGDIDAVCNHALRGFREMAEARKSANAYQAFDMELLHDPSRITANRRRLLPDAKALALHVADFYQPRIEDVIDVPVAALHERFVQEVEAMCERQPDMALHRKKALHTLAETASGYAAAQSQDELPARTGWNPLTERQMLHSTREAFMELVQTKEALEKISTIIG